MRNKLYYYKSLKIRIREIQERIDILRAQAEKITPTLSDDTSHSSDTTSKVERNVIKIVELERRIDKLKGTIKQCDDFLSGLKPYQRYIIKTCLIDHVPYAVIARRENTSTQNIAKIINKVLKEKAPAK
jgi:hypothetical protein